MVMMVRNVERLLSIFQALNPVDYKSWPTDPWISKTVEPWFTGEIQPDESGTWTIPHGSRERTTTPLAPFHKDKLGSTWDSDGCRFIKTLGYGYEELQDWLPKYQIEGRFNEPLFCADVRRSLVDKYGWALPQAAQVKKVARAASDRPSFDSARGESEFGQVSLFATQEKHVAVGHSSVVHERQFNEFVVNVRVNRYVSQ